MITGLLPAKHGIVNMFFHDTASKESFIFNKPSAVDAKWWNGAGEPIWNLVERMGGRTGILFWPGSDITINGFIPSYHDHYQANMSPDERVDRVLNWLDKSMENGRNLDLIGLYFADTDYAGHHHGIDSPEFFKALRRVDQGVRRLMDGLLKRGLEGLIDLMIVSDHGMVNLPAEQVVTIESILPEHKDFIQFADYGPVSLIYPKDGVEVVQLKERLSSAISDHRYPFAVYLLSEVPAKYGYANDASTRLPGIIIEASLGWSLFEANGERPMVVGHHGYDPDYSEMQALFICHGESFKENIGMTEQIFSNMDVYLTLVVLLKIGDSSFDDPEKLVSSFLERQKGSIDGTMELSNFVLKK